MSAYFYSVESYAEIMFGLGRFFNVAFCFSFVFSFFPVSFPGS